MFDDHPTEDEKDLARTLERIAGVGRHLHISMLGISQKPSELLRLSVFSGHATVLLFHRSREFPPPEPNLPLWTLAHNAGPTFVDLVDRQVWYASRGEGDEETTGRVQIPPTEH